MFVIGDIHGEIKMLKNLYDEIRLYDEEVFAVGDIVDRGTAPIECVDFIRQNGIRSVIGNHEEMFLEGMKDTSAGRRMHEIHMYNGGWITEDKFYELDEKRQEDIKGYLSSLPRYIVTQVGKKKVYIMHAGFMLNTRLGTEKSIEYNSHSEDFLWYRDEYLYKRYDKADGLIITGHTPMKKVYHDANRFVIDTGAVFGGPLSAIRIREDGIIEIHQYDRLNGYYCEIYDKE